MPRRSKQSGPPNIDPEAWAIIAAIIATPGDVLARLALADWFYERGKECAPLHNPPDGKPGHWWCTWLAGQHRGYHVVWCGTLEPCNACNAIPFYGHTHIVDVVTLTRAWCPRCYACNDTQPSAGEFTNWHWLCQKCEDLYAQLGWPAIETRRQFHACAGDEKAEAAVLLQATSGLLDLVGAIAATEGL